MNDKLIVSLGKFMNAFENMFDKDWAYTKEMLGVKDETPDQKMDAGNFALETIYVISPDGTFLNPKVADETEDWGSRGELLSTYRELKKLLEDNV